MEWQDIATAPKDGAPVYVKRVHEKRLVCEGTSVFGLLHDHAPSRKPMGLDPLGRLAPQDYAREARITAEWSSSAKWLKPDRMHAFPMPTHWHPAKTEELRASPCS